MPPIDPRLTRGLQLGIQGTAQAEQVAKPGSIVGGQTQVGKTYREQVGKSNEEMLFENLGNIVKGAEAGVDAMAKIRTNIEEKELGEFEINATKILEDEQMSPTDKQARLDTFVKENAPKTWILTGKRDRLIAGIISSGKKQFNYDEKRFLERRVQEYNDQYLELNKGASTVPAEYLLGKLQSDAGVNALLSSGSTEARSVINNLVLERNTQTKLQVQAEMDRKIEMVSIPAEISTPQDLQKWILGTGRAWSSDPEIQSQLLQSLLDLMNLDDRESRNMYIHAMSEIIGLNAFVKTISGKTLVETMQDTTGVIDKEDLGFIARIHKKLSDDFDRARGFTLAQNASLNEMRNRFNAVEQIKNLDASSDVLASAVETLRYSVKFNPEVFGNLLVQNADMRVRKYLEDGKVSKRQAYRKVLEDFSFLSEGEKAILETEIQGLYANEATATIQAVASRKVDPKTTNLEKQFEQGVELSIRISATDDEVKTAIQKLSDYYLRGKGTEDEITKLQERMGIKPADITALVNANNTLVDAEITERIKDDLAVLSIKAEDLTPESDIDQFFDDYLKEKYPTLLDRDRKKIIGYLNKRDADIKQVEQTGLDREVYYALQQIRNAQANKVDNETLQDLLGELSIEAEDVTIDTDLSVVFNDILAKRFPKMPSEARERIIKSLLEMDLNFAELKDYGIDPRVYLGLQKIRETKETLAKSFEEKRSKLIEDSFKEAFNGLEKLNADTREAADSEKTPLIQALVDGSIDPAARNLLISVSAARQLLKAKDLINPDGTYNLEGITKEGGEVESAYNYLMLVIGQNENILSYVNEYDRSVEKMAYIGSVAVYDVLKVTEEKPNQEVIEKAVEDTIQYVLLGNAANAKVDFGTEIEVFNSDGTWTPMALQRIALASLTANRIDEDTTAAKQIGRTIDTVGSRLAQVSNPTDYADPNRILDIAVLHAIGRELKAKRNAGKVLSSISPSQYLVSSSVILSNLSENIALPDIIRDLREGKFTERVLAFKVLAAARVPSSPIPSVSTTELNREQYAVFAEADAVYTGFLSQEQIQQITTETGRDIFSTTTNLKITPDTDMWSADTMVLQLQKGMSTDPEIRGLPTVDPTFKKELVEAIRPLIGTIVADPVDDDTALRIFAQIIQTADDAAPALLNTFLRGFFGPEGVHKLPKLEGETDANRFVKALQLGLDVSIGQQLSPNYSREEILNGVTIGSNQNTVFVANRLLSGVPKRPQITNTEETEGVTRPDYYNQVQINTRFNISTVHLVFDEENPNYAFSRLPAPVENQNAFMEFMLGKKLAGLSDFGNPIQTQDFVEGKIVTRTISPPPKGVTRLDTPGNFVNPDDINGPLDVIGTIALSPRISGDAIKATPEELYSAYMSTLGGYSITNQQRTGLEEAARKVLEAGPISYRNFLERVNTILVEEYNLPSLFTDDFKGFDNTPDAWRLSQQRPHVLPSPRFSGRNINGQPFIMINDTLLKLYEPAVEELRKKHQKILKAYAELGNKDDDISRETLRRRIRFIEEDQP